MANIATYLAKILSATYGEEVRGSIHDAIAAMNVESGNAMSYAATAKESALNSANAAAQSANTAAQSASAAESSNASAIIAKDAAESAKTLSETYMNNAYAYMDNAQTYMNNAHTSETNTANLERSVGEQVADVVNMRENFVKFHSLEDPLLDSSGDVIRDNISSEIRGQTIFADAEDVHKLNRYIANVESLVNKFKEIVKTHAIIDSSFIG